LAITKLKKQVPTYEEIDPVEEMLSTAINTEEKGSVNDEEQI
jgi:hypothetical protein